MDTMTKSNPEKDYCTRTASSTSDWKVHLGGLRHVAGLLGSYCDRGRPEWIAQLQSLPSSKAEKPRSPKVLG